MRKAKKFAAILLSALILSSSFSVLPVSAATVGNDAAVVSVKMLLHKQAWDVYISLQA